ncbi:aminotransferase class V-fold PLP-dependent enzyme [Conexibacter sp. DBS9H8]|uniref:aminotransferase class V-fold PLP-dependent enzyme n=1 Tax=Conexibacter sp. DBS9H8 TaxID=2937801 RepID=UPI00200C4FF8|nr:aminotransferase class V-fold PLP-dependent enzyme [Conexibacter sp. DBS9H8]
MTAEAGRGSGGPATGWNGFQAQFPVLSAYRYLNAGTEGPVPQAAVDAVRGRLDADLNQGRIGAAYLDTLLGLATRARAAYAATMGVSADDVALTESTTSGINTVLGGLRFGPGDEIVTSDQEHPGLLAPLRRLRVRDGVTITVAPFARLSEAVGPRTRLIACSHVSWVGGEVVDVPALLATGVPVLLDGAQALGAIPLDLGTLGVDYYAGSGQKWLCGPEGSGALYVRPDRLEGLEPPWPSYGTVADHGDPLGSALAPTAARLDTSFPPAIRSAWAIASLEVLAAPGWDWVHGRAAFMAGMLANGLQERGVELAARGFSTLVSWRPRADVESEVSRLRDRRILVRSIPSHGLLRASCGAWTSEEDVSALLDAVV